LTARFAPAHALARLFLQGRHQTTSSGADTGQAILFRMNVLFEVYVTQAVRRAVVPLGWRVTAQGPQRPALWRGSSGVFQMKPDVALHRDGLTLIMDAKWKKLTPHARDPRRGIAQADIYQIMAYSQSYAAAAVALVYPHCQGNEPLDRLRIGAGAQDLVVAALPVADAQGMAKAIPELMAWMNQSATK
jgi:5-methylcytosine-specific restriction enzyme subunit McrC